MGSSMPTVCVEPFDKLRIGCAPVAGEVETLPALRLRAFGATPERTNFKLVRHSADSALAIVRGSTYICTYERFRSDRQPAARPGHDPELPGSQWPCAVTAGNIGISWA